MQILYMLERIRSPWLDSLMLAFTEFGSETAFLAAALILFWCVDKRRGYYLISVGFIGTLASQFLKLLCRVPRPWVRDPDFTIVEAAREGAGGYSFPSGHSQTAVGTFSAVAATTQKKWLRIGCIAIAILVPVSRMYLGVHTPQDVIVGSAMAVIIVLLLKPVFFHDDGKYIPWVFAGMILLSLAFVAYVECFPFPAGMDEQNLQEAEKNAYTLLGCMAGMLIVYFFDRKVRPFPVKAVWYGQIIKIVVGLALALLIKSGLKMPLEALIANAYLARAVRYFLLVLAVGLVWPLTFMWFAGLGNKTDKK